MMINVELRETEIIETDFEQTEPCDANMEIGTVTEGIIPDYELLENQPMVNGTTLVGDKTTAELGIGIVGVYENENLTINLT